MKPNKDLVGRYVHKTRIYDVQAISLNKVEDINLSRASNVHDFAINVNANMPT